MVKKSELLSEFEHIVKTQKRAFFGSSFEKIDGFEVRLFGDCHSKGSCFVALLAYRQISLIDRSYVLLARSYPLKDYKSVYQTLVRL